MSRIARCLLLCAALLPHPAAQAKTEVEIAIYGLDSEMEQNVRLFLSIEQQKDHPLLSDGRLRRLHQKASGEIAAALQPFGHYRPSVDGRLEKTETGSWLASYTIDPGPPLPIAVFDFKMSSPMAEDGEFQNLLAKQTLQSGQTFNHIDYEKFKTGLAKLAAERGYFRASFVEHRVEIDLDAYEARVLLTYDGGPRFRFGATELSQDVLNPDFLNRYQTYREGEPYELDKLLDFQQALNDSDYFQTVEISPGAISDDNDEVPVDVVLSPRKRHRYELGLGYGTDTGARARFGWKMPRVNRRGHKFDSSLRLSERGYSATANYRVPVLNPRTDQVVYNVGQIEKDFEDSESLLRKLGVNLSQSRGDWRETLSLNYEEEEFIAADDSGDSSLLIPGVSWSRTWGENFINVLDGLRFDISLRGANADLASDIDFSQVQGSIKFITSLGPRDRIIARGGLGATSTDEFDDLPTSLRFYSGGARSVRGFAYNSLGPVDDDDEVVGGRYMLFGGIEYEHFFDDRWGVAVFLDAGNAMDDLDEDLEQGAGFGLRWKSPAGPVRIDIANAISDDDRPWRLHINIGPDL